jgi:hypothetical protein
MSARDDLLENLYAARERLSDLIVGWTPDPAADPETRKKQAEGLKDLLAQRGQVNRKINEAIAAAFKDVASPELVAASEQLGSLTRELKRFGKTVADVNRVIGLADQVLAAASKVIKIAVPLI